MREQQGEAAALSPLVFGRDDELVDDDLAAVAEVSELRFPADERVLIRDRIAVLEAERCELRQRGVVDHERRGVVAEVGERNVFLLGEMVDDHRMALREGASARVLAREANRSS